MKIEWRALAGKLIPGLTSAILMAGCSSNSPMSPEDGTLRQLKGGTENTTLAAQVEFASRVATTDVSLRRLTFTGNSEIVFADADAEIVRRESGIETPIEFGDIVIGDSVEVRGNRQSDNSVLANRLRVKIEDNNNEVEFGGRVATIDASARTMTFVGNSTLINVAADAEVMNHDLQVQIDLSEIVPGDSVEVRGMNQADGSVLADRVRLRKSDNQDADLEFKANITAIDYSAGFFTVSGRTETILVDAGTMIFANLSRSTFGLGKHGHDDGGDDSFGLNDTLLNFTDLHVGDLVEVHANIVDTSTLLAVRIELEDADGVIDDTQFTATIASIDPQSGTVTFSGQSWAGVVSETAVLTGFNNEPISLSDFPVGQLVEVKGFPHEGDALEVVRMHKEDNL